MNFKRILCTAALLAGLCWVSAPAADAPPKLADQLLSPDRDTRLQAIDQFNKLAEDAKYRLVPDLMVGLTDEDPAVRARAAKILNVMGVTTHGKGPDARQSLSDQRKNDKGLDPGDSLKEIQHDKQGSFPDLKHELEEEKKAQGGMDASDLKSDKDARGTSSPLLEALKDPDPVMRARAARHVGSMHPPVMDAIPLLSEMLTDKDTEVRASAAGALGSIGPAAQSAIPALTQRLADSDPGVRQIVADAIKQINSPQ